LSVRDAVKLARQLSISKSLAPEVAIDRALDEVAELGYFDEVSEPEFRGEVTRELTAFGKLQPLLDDPAVEEIWINSPHIIRKAIAGRSIETQITLSSDEIESIIERMLRPTGRRLDRSNPFIDASLPDGSRLHVVIPEITKKHWSVNIRKFPKRIMTLDKLEALESISGRQRCLLEAAIQQGLNVLVSGATQSGKTTLLCALLQSAPEQQRIISVEETFEIQIEKPDWVAMQTRQAGLEGGGLVDLRRLIKEALRMRPDRIVVGEVREAESLDLLIALNSGLPGLCTIHANSAKDAIAKICTLPLLAGANISSEFVNATVGSCLNLVVHCELMASGHRKVTELLSVTWNETTKTIELQNLEKL
jgi:pilus assembly protein CpaF